MALSKAATSIIIALISSIATIAVAYISASNGLIFPPNQKLSRQVDNLAKTLNNQSSLTGDYEWQWEGENWLGSVTFHGLASGGVTARLDMRSVISNPQTHAVEYASLFRSSEDGSVTLVDGHKIELSMPVDTTPQYRKVHPSAPTRLTLNGELYPVEAFAGRVKYDGGDDATGDMILVRYRTDFRRW